MKDRSWSDDDVRDMVARTTAAQGLPHHVENATTIAKVVAIFDSDVESAPDAEDGQSGRRTPPAGEMTSDR